MSRGTRGAGLVASGCRIMVPRRRSPFPLNGTARQRCQPESGCHAGGDRVPDPPADLSSASDPRSALHRSARAGVPAGVAQTTVFATVGRDPFVAKVYAGTSVAQVV